MEDNILEIRNISKHFAGVTALDNVSLDVRRGEVHALMGENGAGKSTLIKILTLALFYIERGLAQVVSGIGTVTYSYPALQKFFITPIFGHIPVHFFILLVAVLVMYIVVNRMRFGARIEAFGSNPLAARISGINTTRIVIIAYVVSALFAWLSGMLEMTVVTCADPFRTGQDMEINAIASVVVGGTNIKGGYPNIIGSICGAFLLQLITMMCNMNNITYSIALMIKAGIIVSALFFHGFREQ